MTYDDRFHFEATSRDHLPLLTVWLSALAYPDPIYQPLRSGRIWHKVNFKRSLTGFNSEFSFS